MNAIVTSSIGTGLQGDPFVDFVHDLNNHLLAIRGYASLALAALDEAPAAGGDAAADLESLLAVVDEATAASRTFRRSLIAPAS